MTEAPRILVCGYYGFGNTGDEAILTVLLDDLRAAHPGADITVMSGAPSATQGDHGVAAVHWQDVASMISAAHDADLMVLGGGGLFQDHHVFDESEILTPAHGGIGYYSGFALLARLTGTPLAIYGVGVGPLKTDLGKRWTRIALQHASAASVRDERSRELLEAVGVDISAIGVTADPAWAMTIGNGQTAASILGLEDIPPGNKKITVSVRPWDEYSWADPLAAALDSLLDDLDARVLFVPFQDSPYAHENDAQASVEVLRRMARHDRASIVRGKYSVEERAALIASSDLLVAMRLHAAIIGLVSEVPTIALAYDPKVTATMADARRPQLSLPLDKLDADGIVSMAKTAIDLAPTRTVTSLRDRAGRNQDVLRPDGPLPEMTAEAADAIGRLLTAQVAANAEVKKLRTENAVLERQHEYDVRAYERLEEQRRELANTKAVRLFDSYWKARDAMRTSIGKVANRAPKSIRPTLKRIGVEPSKPTTPPEEPDTVDPQALSDAQTAFRKVLDQHPDVPGIVVYPPSIGWSVSLFQRPQQMALAFARLGYLVFYGVDRHFGGGVAIESPAERVYLYPATWTMTEAIGQIPSPLAVSYVYNYSWTERLSDPRVIFEHIDELEVFTTTYGMEQLDDWFDEAVAGAELVIGSARDLVQAIEARRPDALLCPNGVDYRHFADYAEAEPPEDIADIAGGGKPIIGYYGALAEWVDYPLIRKSALGLPDFDFVFIGPDYDGSINAHIEVFGLPNVRWLGVKDYAELPAYLHYFDVATIPFVVNEVTHSVSPLKLFEYMAGERPIVTPDLRECAHYEAVQIAQDADDYVAKLRHAATELRHDPDHQALLRRTARANTWEMRVGTLIDALARAGRL